MFEALVQYLHVTKRATRIHLENTGGEATCRCYIGAAKALGWTALDEYFYPYNIDACSTHSGGLNQKLLFAV